MRQSDPLGGRPVDLRILRALDKSVPGSATASELDGFRCHGD